MPDSADRIQFSLGPIGHEAFEFAIIFLFLSVRVFVSKGSLVWSLDQQVESMSIRLSNTVRVRVHRNCEGMNDLIVRLNRDRPNVLNIIEPINRDSQFYAISCGLSRNSWLLSAS